uniref:Uncharacterized protein n=1 Tax=Strombidium inclinatum TaxID=197538 RepID=A0A7S3ILS1_9SPIT|mmetsp:Transcript_27253/g.41452  ORF Transcript_27253/g.41452 Transcript_27253/m.41452 type:complete len:298 (+) Transcript_27253:93-986(+)
MRGKQDRAEDAKDLYLQAANCYKLGQQMDQAIECYELCIKCEESDRDAASHYREAANCIKGSDVDKYVELISKAIDIYSLSGRGSTAAGMAKDCAQLMEEQFDYEQAVEFYSKAAQLYELDGQSTQGQQMKLKSIELKLLSKQFDQIPQCIKAYEKIAKKYLSQPILASSAKDLFFMSCLCFLANDDVVGAKKQMQMYCIEDSRFEGSREQDLIARMIACIQDKNRDDFTVAVSDYNAVTPFKKVQTSLLVKIKEQYLPEDSANLVKDSGDIDFTGANEGVGGGGAGNEDEQEIDFT